MNRQWVATLVMMIGLVGCSTKSTTEVTNFEGSSTVSSTFDSTNAAIKRVEAAKRYLGRGNLERAKFHLDKAAEHDDDY
ncbi:MAG: hypothetical protein V2I33_04055, partial [Kangiellaceae bacterium]|nr:hypothetical protein [Kangiellaceae bacterium]